MDHETLTADTAFVLALFAVFTVSVLFVLLSGAGVYKATAASVSDSYGARTAEAYISSKVRHSDALDDGSEPLVAIRNFEDITALALYEEYDGGARRDLYILVRWLYNRVIHSRGRHRKR